jgi:flavin-binding protein dodecin
MSISRTTEVKSSSKVSFDDAMKKGIARAQKTLKNVKSAWIWNQEILLDDKGKIDEYRVQMKITFLLEE